MSTDVLVEDLVAEIARINLEIKALWESIGEISPVTPEDDKDGE